MQALSIPATLEESEALVAETAATMTLESEYAAALDFGGINTSTVWLLGALRALRGCHCAMDVPEMALWHCSQLPLRAPVLLLHYATAGQNCHPAGVLRWAAERVAAGGGVPGAAHAELACC